MKMYLRKSNIFAFVCLVVISLCSTPSRAAEEAMVMSAQLTGRAGDSITCFEVKAPEEYSIVFSRNVGQLSVSFTRMNAKGQEERETYASKDGNLPIIAGQIKRLTVEFSGPGSCSVEVHARR